MAAFGQKQSLAEPIFDHPAGAKQRRLSHLPRAASHNGAYIASRAAIDKEVSIKIRLAQ